MKLSYSQPTIVISDAPVGYDVEISPEIDKLVALERFCATHMGAVSYANSLSLACGWPIEDRTVACVGSKTGSAMADRGCYTTSYGKMTGLAEDPPTVWDEDGPDPENLDEIDAARESAA